MLLNPHLTSCRFGCGWELAVSSFEEKQRRERVHAERVHFASADAVTGLMADDPTHTDDFAEVVAAIEMDGQANNGEVDPNRVRHLIPSHVQPQMVGTAYRVLVTRGRLREIGWTTNRDRHGRNDGKPIRLYELVTA
jgi:hypothetical protein